MRSPEKSLIQILKTHEVDFVCSLPCEKIKTLLELLPQYFFHIPLTREEEGVGICAGIALAGQKPAMFVQSSGIGNMLNALLSLTGFYEFPLAIFVSQRGIYKEQIAAQVPMGQRLPKILKGAGIKHSIINSIDDFKQIGKKLSDVYRKNKIHAFLLNPKIWEDSEYRPARQIPLSPPLLKGDFQNYPTLLPSCPPLVRGGWGGDIKKLKPKFTRFDILKIIAPYLDSKVVVCNLGFPSKELFHIKHQPSNFYMLGSMGMATPIGLGISLVSDKDVVVIDGDGGLLMNPGSLATAGFYSPRNLTIIAIDNGSYGSTGDQPTLTSAGVDLEIVAKGLGIKNTYKASTKKHLIDAMKDSDKGLKFIHALALPGNKDVPPIPLHHLTIKQQVQEFLKT